MDLNGRIDGNPNRSFLSPIPFRPKERNEKFQPFRLKRNKIDYYHLKPLVPNEVDKEPIFRFGRNLDLNMHPCMQDPEYSDLKPSHYMFWLQDLNSGLYSILIFYLALIKYYITVLLVYLLIFIFYLALIIHYIVVSLVHFLFFYPIILIHSATYFESRIGIGSIILS